MSKTKVIDGETSWVLAGKTVRAAVTCRGGHVSPCAYRINGQFVSLFEPSPWAKEPLPADTPAIIRVLRGDFFCMPFGAGPGVKGETHPVHGQTANDLWTLQSLTRAGGRTSLHATMNTTVRRGRVDKHLMLIDGHTALYSRHVLSGFRGSMNYGHHAIVKFQPDSPGVISTSRFALGQVFDGRFENPALGGYQSFKPAATFTTLRKVPSLFGRTTDAAVFPAREGFEDLLMLQARPTRGLGWTAVTLPKRRLVWFGLKDTATLPGTVMWFSNGGRHYAPWSGRHRSSVGLEEVCSYFHRGLAASVKPNAHTRRGLKTAMMLSPGKPLTINYIMAMAAVSGKFDEVAAIDPISGGVRLTARSGVVVETPVDLDFLWQSRTPG